MMRLMAAGAAALALGLAYAAPAMADPPAPGPGFAQCGDQLVPLDPRVSVRDPLGTLIFQRLLEQMCPPHT